MTGHNRDTTAPACERPLRHAPHQRLAIKGRQQLVWATHAARFSRSQDDRMHARRPRRRLARLRPGRNLHQQAAYAHAGNVAVRHVDAGDQPVQHPVEAVILRDCAHSPARPAPACRLFADNDQIARIDRHADAHNASACLLQSQQGSRRPGRSSPTRRTRGRCRCQPAAF
jgi:hypothetical protein